MRHKKCEFIEDVEPVIHFDTTFSDMKVVVKNYEGWTKYKKLGSL